MKKNNIKYIYEKSLPFDEMGAKIGFPLIKKVYSGKSKYQTIEVFDLKFWGRTMYLDGVLQTTERDEFIYHEMITHPPLFSVKNPEKVLIIGGGDGGSLKEVLKHKSVKEVILCELDEKVVEVSRKFLTKISEKSHEDKRAKVLIKDGRELIKEYSKYFDVIILDLPDPSDNCKFLISVPFYKEVKKALTEKGIISVQSESLTNQIKLAALINKNLNKVFKFVVTQKLCVPSYQAGEFSLTMASDLDLNKTDIKELKNKSSNFKFKYWSPEIHFSSRVLPKYISESLK
jgi:spermidine synthase